MAGIDWLKNTTIYKDAMVTMVRLKSKIKEKWQSFRVKYFAKDSSFVEELKAFYAYVKDFNKNIKKRKEEKEFKEDKKID
jgi:hypothetical protein